MSAINFTSAASTLQVLGTERYHLLEVVQRQAGGAVGEGHLPTVEQLNACLRMPNAAAILAARLSAQVELVLWVDGDNRAWLAGIIAEGLQRVTTDAQQVLSPGVGWAEVQQLLLLDDTEPVFIWSTTGAPFPNSEGWEGSPDEWEALGPDMQAVHTEGILRQESAAEDATSHLAEHPTLVAAPFSRELRPVNWYNYFLSELLTA
jgi:hypothetical protein